MNKTRIEWTDATWNPVSGCTKVSKGCHHCYAERQWPRLNAPGMPYAGRSFTDVACHPDRLDQPLRWRKPRRIFVNSMSDLFHESVPDSFIDQVFAVMALARQHTFQVLTKRPERMLEYMTAADRRNAIEHRAVELTDSPCAAGAVDDQPWPLPNVWLGVSVEDQETADERIPLLLKTPAAVRWISAEPLLGPVDLERGGWSFLRPMSPPPGNKGGWRRGLDWVVVGGESGPKARPIHPGWARTLRDQCKAAAVPLLFKQWGEFCNHVSGARIRLMPDLFMHADGRQASEDVAIADGGSWAGMFRLGKKRAGRMLDGELLDEYPK